MTGTLLPIPDEVLEYWRRAVWHDYQSEFAYPRSVWLHDFEAVLRELHPAANSDSLTLTARSVAPFPLAQGHDVP